MCGRLGGNGETLSIAGGELMPAIHGGRPPLWHTTPGNDAGRNPYLAQRSPFFASRSLATACRPGQRGQRSGVCGRLEEEPVATGVILIDERAKMRQRILG